MRYACVNLVIPACPFRLGRQAFHLIVALREPGTRFPIRPVGLLPGGFVELHAKSVPEVWVRNPEMLSSHIERGPVVVKAEDVAAVASRICLRIR